MSLSRLESFLQLLQAKKLLLKARGIYIAYNTADHIDSWVTNNVDFYRDLNFIILDESRSKEFNPKSFEPFIKKIVPIKGAQV